MAVLSFGERIRAKRLALLAADARFSLRRLGGRLGIQPSYLSRLERGAAPSLSEEHLLALARELGDDPDLLCALAGKLPGDVRRILLNAPGRLLPLVRKSNGLILEDDDPNGHGAIAGMSLDIPVIIGAENATKILRSGTVITLDAARGVVSCNSCVD